MRPRLKRSLRPLLDDAPVLLSGASSRIGCERPDKGGQEEQISMKQSEDDTMPRIAMLFAALCIAAAPIIATSKAFAQKEPDKLDKADKADKADKPTSKPESEKGDQFELDKIMRGMRDMIEKGLKEDKPAPPK
jgi:hypothetical protein